jgi:DeoR/GlpR family transcriptional regulator of sugar metabolism
VRKSAHMIREGMIVILDGKERTVVATDSVDRGGWQVITISCADGAKFNRTLNAKVEVVGKVPKSRRK